MTRGYNLLILNEKKFPQPVAPLDYLGDLYVRKN